MPDSFTSGTFYMERLYPLQNRILNVINELCPSLYLTGGTALSRFYFTHRYSDDLELFANDESSFSSIVEKAVAGIMTIEGVSLQKMESGVGDGYVRIEVAEGDISLTIDFVNGIVYRLGKPERREGFTVDTLSNIFTNKISAIIGRDELKDIVDVREICRSCLFKWDRVIEVSQEKESSVDGEYIDYRLSTLIDYLNRQAGFLDTINWIRKPDTSSFISDLEKIRREIISLSENTLCSEEAIVLDALM